MTYVDVVGVEVGAVVRVERAAEVARDFDVYRLHVLR